MKKIYKFILLIGSFSVFYSCQTSKSPEQGTIMTVNPYEYQNAETRWSSFENITATKGQGGAENKGAKGHACDEIKAGQCVTLLDIAGPGIITRMWFTIIDRSPEMLRALKIEIYWDGTSKPAVSAPFGDFFGIGLGKKTAFENDLFADPEGRSFICFIKMPFKKSAKLIVTNESSRDLTMLFYDINLQMFDQWKSNNLYFHCYWHRDTATTLGEDYQILPKINGKGRYLGANIGINPNPLYKGSWWGEGEVKMYMDNDTDLPTLVGTGSEDYIGTAWGQGKFCTRYSGCLVAGGEKNQYAFFRYHIPDPVFFKNDIKVAIQQIGGDTKEKVIELQKKGIPLIPTTIHEVPVIHPIYNPEKPVDLTDQKLPGGFTNFYRSDDVSSTAYFYLDKPENDLPQIQSVKIRVTKL